jgi:anaerobic ribonucleoside-triphosphate reductase activating protein
MEFTLALLDEATGSLLVNDELGLERLDIDSSENVGCARPLSVSQSIKALRPSSMTARINGFWHDDLMVGPGRRSVVRFQGCPIRCVGCWVPETHDENGGSDMDIAALADELLDSHERDGVTILGGEPFAQPAALARLLVELRNRQPNVSIVVYSGYALEALKVRLEAQGYSFILELIGMLVDGPYVRSRAHSLDCGCDDETQRWTGSCNQKVRHLQ